MATLFAPAERAGEEELREAIAVATVNPVIDAVMQSFGGLLAVLNEQRQVLAVNQALLSRMNLAGADEVLGLRPGEALHCVHADDPPAGCGTTRFCVSCGAAIAIVAAMDSGRPEQRECVMTVQKNGSQEDLAFNVRSCPLTLAGRRFVLIFLRDVSTQKRRAALERTFFHDIGNIIAGLSGASELLETDEEADKQERRRQIRHLARRLMKEVEIQRALAEAENPEYRVTPEKVPVAEVLREIEQSFDGNPVAAGKTLRIMTEGGQDQLLMTDLSLLLRIVTNMVTNALEATEEGGVVRRWISGEPEGLAFCVWNRQPVPAEARLRIFQQYFSTKSGAGRGLGTYAMKLFGEKYLKGKVDFTTSETEGTVFRFHAPRRPVF